jgi:hypothetical protein
MFKKMLILGLSTVILGGCTMTNMFNSNNAAQDSKMEATESPAPSATPDADLEAMPSTSSSSDDKSLETDINNTTILNEDFSDLN